MIELNSDLPEAERDKSLGISIVWLIPLIAILVGGWLAYKTISEKGPEIVIAFDEAEGLEPGQTRIKYKDVNIGKINSVTLSGDLSQVLVTARLNKSMSGHLNENSRFWIVRPRINSSGISGLSTLISGIHIAMDPGEGDLESSYFQGLSTAPDIEFSAEGKKFTLTADSLGSLDRGSPVYHRQIQVGEVTQYELSEDGESVNINVFVRSPYDQLISHNTRFWNASGVSVELGTAGISADMESLSALISGGIAFETPVDLDAEPSPEPREQYALHPNHRTAIEKPYINTELFVMYFDGSLRGLRKGSVVEFMGIEIGKVLDIDLKLNHETLEVRAPVLVELHPETIVASETIENGEEIVNAWIERGLRAQLSTSNLLTGQLFIDLAFHKDTDPFKPRTADNIAVFPTIPAAFDRLAQSATDTFEKLAQIPLLEISQEIHKTIQNLNSIIDPNRSGNTLANLNDTLINIRSLSAKMNKSVPRLSNRIETTLRKLESTLSNTDKIVAEDSQLVYEVHEMLRSLSEAAKSIDSLSNYLERNPSSLLYGKSGNR